MSDAPYPSSLRQTLALSAFVFTTLIAVYGLSYAGVFTSDDEHILAASALSLARWGQLDTAPAFGNSRLRELQQLPHFTDIEPGQAILGSLFVRLADTTGLGALQSLFWLNSIVTALTAVVVLLVVRQLGYPPSVALVAAFGYGLGTLAWPYAQTFFRDPLAALFVAAAYLAFETALADGQTSRTRLIAGIFTVVLLSLGLLAKITVGVAAAMFALAALVRIFGTASLRAYRRTLLVWLSAVFAILLLAALLVPATGPFARLSASYFQFLLDALLRRDRAGLWAALLGPFVSPGKSLFVYSPVLLLTFVSLTVAWRARWRELLTPWLTLLGLIVAQALLYGQLWAGFNNWGPRYLLPALPLLTAACAPALAAILSTRSAPVRTAAIGLAVASLLVQIPGLVIPVPAYYARLDQLGPEAGLTPVWDARYSPIVGHWQLLFEGAEWKLAAPRVWAAAPMAVTLITVGWILLFGLSARGAWRVMQTPLKGRAQRGLLVAAWVLALVLPVGTLRVSRADPAYSADREAFRSAIQLVERATVEGDVILVQAYGQPLWDYSANYSRAPFEWYSLPLHFPSPAELDALSSTGDPTPALDSATIALFESLPTQFRRVWLINDLAAPPGDLRLEAQWLAQHHSQAGEWNTTDASGAVQVSLFSLR